MNFPLSMSKKDFALGSELRWLPDTRFSVQRWLTQCLSIFWCDSVMWWTFWIKSKLSKTIFLPVSAGAIFWPVSSFPHNCNILALSLFTFSRTTPLWFCPYWSNFLYRYVWDTTSRKTRKRHKIAWKWNHMVQRACWGGRLTGLYLWACLCKIIFRIEWKFTKCGGD